MRIRIALVLALASIVMVGGLAIAPDASADGCDNCDAIVCRPGGAEDVCSWTNPFTGVCHSDWGKSCEGASRSR